MSTQFTVEPQAFTPLPAGEYAVHIVAVDPVKFNAEKNREETTINYKVADGEYKDRLIRFDSFYSMESTIWKAKALLSALGVEKGTVTTFEEAFKNIKGKSLIVNVIVDTYNGKENNKVRGYSPCDLPPIVVEETSNTSTSANTPAPADVDASSLF